MNEYLEKQKKFKCDYADLIEKLANPEPNAPKPMEYVIEECAELIQAIQHMRRANRLGNSVDKVKAREAVVEEMAHVYTVLDTARAYHDIDWYEIEGYQQKLIDRYLNQPIDGRHIPDKSGQPDRGGSNA